MKEYTRHKGGRRSHCIVFTQNMLEGMKEAKRKNDERILEEHKAEEEVRQKLKEDADKKKKTRGSAEECSKIKEKFRRKRENI